MKMGKSEKRKRMTGLRDFIFLTIKMVEKLSHVTNISNKNVTQHFFSKKRDYFKKIEH